MNQAKITQRIHEISGDTSIQPGHTKYISFYQRAQAQLWDELSDSEKEKWQDEAFSQSTRPKTPAEKSLYVNFSLQWIFLLIDSLDGHPQRE